MKKLLMIGAGFLQSFVIKKAKMMGIFVVAIDGNINATGFQYADKFKVVDIVDKEQCLSVAKEEKVDGVLTAATDYGVLTASYIANQLNLPGLPYEVALLIKNKYLVKKRLFENRVDDSKTFFEISNDNDVLMVKNNISYPVMVKPCDGSGSRGANRADNFSQLVSACNKAINSSLTKKALVEPFILGKEYGVESFVTNGKVYVLSVMSKLMTNPPFYAELGHSIPNDLPPKLDLKIRRIVKKAIKVLGINYGSVNMDIIVSNKGDVHIVDIGARMGGNLIGSHIIPYGTGVDYLSWIIKSSMGEHISLYKRDKRRAVCSRLLAFKKGVVKNIPDFQRIEKEYNVEIFHHIKLGETVNEYHTNLDGCGYIVSSSDSLKQAINNADAALLKIKKIIF